MGDRTWDVLVIGASAFDIKIRATEWPAGGGPVHGHIRLSVGGVGRNIAENLARLELNVALFSAISADAFGDHLLAATADAGVDVTQVLRSGEFRPGSYLAFLNESGEPHWTIDDMGIMHLISPSYIVDRRAWFRDTRAVVMDANLSPLAIQAVVTLCRRYGVPLCVDPTTTLLAERIKPHLAHIWLLTPNAAEAEVLCGQPVRHTQEALEAARELIAQGVRTVVITLGEEGAVYATAEEYGRVPAMDVEVVDLTGVGDALTAATVFGLLNEFPVDEAVRLGVSAATLTITCAETVRPDLSLDSLYDWLL
ncbi:MAG: carbohydrate kinase family protein [Ardenticatenia bacterium]|nr:carbohydrate kinase family protein [Ardenticatenia bacterium]